MLKRKKCWQITYFGRGGGGSWFLGAENYFRHLQQHKVLLILLKSRYVQNYSNSWHWDSSLKCTRNSLLICNGKKNKQTQSWVGVEQESTTVSQSSSSSKFLFTVMSAVKTHPPTSPHTRTTQALHLLKIFLRTISFVSQNWSNCWLNLYCVFFVCFTLEPFLIYYQHVIWGQQ